MSRDRWIMALLGFVAVVWLGWTVYAVLSARACPRDMRFTVNGVVAECTAPAGLHHESNGSE